MVHAYWKFNLTKTKPLAFPPNPSFPSEKFLAYAIIMSCQNYSSLLLSGLPLFQLGPIISVLNSTAKIISLSHRTDYILPLFISLCWLPQHSRIQQKSLCFDFQSPPCPCSLSSFISYHFPARELWPSPSVREFLVFLGDYDTHLYDCPLHVHSFLSSIKSHLNMYLFQDALSNVNLT